MEQIISDYNAGKIRYEILNLIIITFMNHDRWVDLKYHGIKSKTT